MCMETPVSNNLAFSYIKCALKTKNNNPSGFTKQFSQLSVNINQRKGLANLLGLANANELPMTSYFLNVFPSLLDTFTDKRFPFNPVGMIHLSSAFYQESELDFGRNFNLEVKVLQAKQTLKGNEIEIDFSILQDNETKIQIKNVFLKKTKKDFSKNTNEKSTNENVIKKDQNNHRVFHSDNVIHTLNQSDVKQYATLSKDINPVHINNVLARLFGQSSSLAHGMLLAHIAAVQVVRKTNKKPKALFIDFKRPCYLPANLVFEQQEENYYLFSKKERNVLHVRLKSEY